ncbi:hypothetical protein SDC9_203048 [bioreactor metagenome]|uniref:Major facilitator superfamily (MFS) profile domain-containing protein n=2 Tax=root TaxID=1 RepID=A0A645IW09_9ZZZZ
MPLFFIAVILLTIGEVLIAINSSAFIANNTPDSHRGRISSFIPMISGAGYALGPMIMGKIIDLNGIFIAWIIVTSVAFIGSIGILLLKKISLKELRYNSCEALERK